MNKPSTTANPNGKPTLRPEERRLDDESGSLSGPETFSKISSVAQQAGSRASEAVSSVASEAGAYARGMLDEQVRAGAHLVGHIAESVRAAADALEQDAPGLSRLARAGANKADDLSEALRNRSAGDLVGSASEFTRQNPAVVFGGAALVGFLLYRTLTSASPELAHARYDDKRKADPRGGTPAKRLDQSQGDLTLQNQPS